MATQDLEAFLQGFSKLDRKGRFERLQKMGFLKPEHVRYLKSGGTRDIQLAEKFIENVIGYFELPLGVATNFVIDGKEMAIPMAVEETSIVAAASKTARWVRRAGRLTTWSEGVDIIGQIQIAKVKDWKKLESAVVENREHWIQISNEDVASGLVNRGGGVKDIQLRKVDRGDGDVMGVIHVMADPCDAMGANIMNQVCEYLKTHIESASEESVTMCILSNLVDTKLSCARIEMDGISPEQGEKIVEAGLFAKMDPYRAATNNKGVLNGVDPILIATGNDWRAVEAGVHAYAARDGRYRSITTWSYDKQTQRLVGEFKAPIVAGTVGGVTKLHPTAQMCLAIMDIESAAHLGRICAAVGLVQNLGALNALTSVGIIEGHMKLHIKNLTLGAGANETEMPIVARKLEEILNLTKRISLSQAVEVLKELRSQKPSTPPSSSV